jgi:hypothetical protein
VEDWEDDAFEEEAAEEAELARVQPLNDIFGNRDSSSRISKSAMKLSEYVVDIEKRSATQGRFCSRVDRARLFNRGQSTRIIIAHLL